MRPSRVAAVVAGVGLPLATFGQGYSFTPDSRITYTISADEAPGGNGNGIIEPGESVLLRIGASFTNQNTIAHFSPPIGTWGSGTIRGFGTGWFDIDVTGPTASPQRSAWPSAARFTRACTWNPEIRRSVRFRSRSESPRPRLFCRSASPRG